MNLEGLGGEEIGSDALPFLGQMLGVGEGAIKAQHYEVPAGAIVGPIISKLDWGLSCVDFVEIHCKVIQPIGLNLQL